VKLGQAGIALILLLGAKPALAQPGAPAPPVSFAQVTGVPVPLESASGRFSSLNPLDQAGCARERLTGRVVSPRLIMVKQISCGLPGHDNVLVNVELADPADAAQMVVGRHVSITATLKSAEEFRDALFDAEFLIAEKAEFVSGDPLALPAPAFTSYMLCQAPELDPLAAELGRELCVQNTILADLAAAAPALKAAAQAPAKLSPTDAVPGAREAISCRLDPRVSDRNLPAIACARNSYWAWYRAKWRDPRSSTPAPP
jgi:hypothetical protein